MGRSLFSFHSKSRWPLLAAAALGMLLVFLPRAHSKECFNLLSSAEETTKPQRALPVDVPSQKFKKTVVLVDVVSSGVAAAREALAAGLHVIVVTSRPMGRDAQAVLRKLLKEFGPEKLSLLSMAKTPASKFLNKTKKDSMLIAQLVKEKGLSIVGIFPVSEAGTEYSGILVDEMVQSQGLDLSKVQGAPFNAAYFVKPNYLKAQEEAGLPVPVSLTARSEDEAVQTVNESDLLKTSPVVIVKPAFGAGKKGVAFVSNPQELGSAVIEILDAEGVYGTENKQVLIQEALAPEKESADGEYNGFVEGGVNGFVFNLAGVRYVFFTSVMIYDKFIYNGAELAEKKTLGPAEYDAMYIPEADSPFARIAIQTAEKILSTLKYPAGFFHIEVYSKAVNGRFQPRFTYSSDGGFRPPGGGFPQAILGGYNGANEFRTLFRLLAQEGEVTSADLQKLPKVFQRAMPTFTMTINNFGNSGIVNRTLDAQLNMWEQKIRRDGGIFYIDLAKKMGVQLSRSGDFFDKIGFFAVAHPDKNRAAYWIYRMRNETQWFESGTGGFVLPEGWENRKMRWEPEEVFQNRRGKRL